MAAGQHAAHRLRVRDVALHEREAGMALHVGQVLAPAGVGELVQDDDLPLRARARQEPREVRADEARPARHQDSRQRWLIPAVASCPRKLPMEPMLASSMLKRNTRSFTLYRDLIISATKPQHCTS